MAVPALILSGLLMIVIGGMFYELGGKNDE